MNVKLTLTSKPGMISCWQTYYDFVSKVNLQMIASLPTYLQVEQQCLLEFLLLHLIASSEEKATGP